MTNTLKDHIMATVPISQIHDGNLLRLSMDREAIICLAESIKSQGLIHPLLVRRKSEDRYIIIAGRRRLAALMYLGISNTAVTIVQSSEAQLLAVIENLQRRDLNPRDEALAIKNLVASGKVKQNDLCRLLDKDKRYVSHTVKLGTLVHQFGARVSFMKLPRTVYWKLLATPELLKQAEDENWNQQEAARQALRFQLHNGKRPKSHSRRDAKSHLRATKTEQYQAVNYFEGGFILNQFTYLSSSSQNKSLVLEKLQEALGQIEHALDTIKKDLREDLRVVVSKLDIGTIKRQLTVNRKNL